jgi:hypothetical protein
MNFSDGLPLFAKYVEGFGIGVSVIIGGYAIGPLRIWNMLGDH